MKHESVLEHLALIFPSVHAAMTEWFPCGKDTVRIKLCDNSELMFMYVSKSYWKLETRESHVDYIMRGER